MKRRSRDKEDVVKAKRCRGNKVEGGRGILVEVVIDDGDWPGEVGEPARTTFGDGSRLGICMRMIIKGSWETMFI